MKQLIFAVFFVALTTGLPGQNIVGGHYYDFNNAQTGNNVIGDWRVAGDVRTTPDGRAGADELFGERERIASASRQTAVLITLGDGDETRFSSPNLGLLLTDEIWLGFHQYYRQNTNDRALIELKSNGETFRTIDLNDSLAEGAETGPHNRTAIDISDLRDVNNPSLDFVLRGKGYFWLLDDIGIYDGKPFNATIPPVMGNYLDDQQYPFAIDTADWAYVPNQLVIQFNPAASQEFRDGLRRDLGAEKIDSCACDFVELWEIDGSLFQSQGGQQEPATGSTGILSNIKKAKAQSKVDGVDLIDGVDLNTYNLTKPEAGIRNPATAITDFAPLGFGSEIFSAVRVAIMDTGIDYTHPRIKPFVHRSEASRRESEIDGENCLENDGIGWNFVDGNNNPYDDNGHGTHVAGILVDSLSTYDNAACEYEIVAYKTHDHNGISTLFDVACATFQASLDDIDIINDSWGFFGDSSIILANAVDTAETNGILLISAAGNDAIDLDTLAQYPACYAANNIVTVAASDTFINPEGVEDMHRASFSNFSPVFVDIVAPGEDIVSAVPADALGNFRPDAPKSGTSMATPMVSAEAALMFSCLADQLQQDSASVTTLKKRLLGAAESNFRFNETARNGRVLAYTEGCACSPTSLPAGRPAGPLFQVFPNPFTDHLRLRSVGFRGGLRISLLDATGREVYGAERNHWLPETTQSITLPRLKVGVYFLRLSGNGYSWTEKLLRF